MNKFLYFLKIYSSFGGAVHQLSVGHGKLMTKQFLLTYELLCLVFE